VSPETALTVERLTVAHRASGCPIVDSVSFSLAPGEILGLVGESGSGKTSLALALLGYTRAGAALTAGRIQIGGCDLTSATENEWRRQRGGVIAYVPQDPATALNPAHRIGRQISETVRLHAGEAPSSPAVDRVGEALTAVGLPDDPAFARRYPHQLSGGQQQRVALALAFAAHPRVLVLDEPTTGLDVTTQGRVLELVHGRCEQTSTAAVYVSHDLAAVGQLADRIAVMYSGRLIEIGATKPVLVDARHPYTARLVAATPDLHSDRLPIGIPGRALSPFEPVAGCRFAPRCDQADSRCRTEVPPLVEHADGHASACWHAHAVAVTIPRTRPPRPARDPAAVLTSRSLAATHGAREVLADVDLQVKGGACLAVVGESGSGKTTLARCLIGLHPDRTGEIALLGETLARRVEDRTTEQRRALQYVFQNPYGSLNPRHTIQQILAGPLHAFEGGRMGRHHTRMRTALDRVALPATMLDRLPGQLSGGERQRVAIARALITSPRVLICDEVTSALDVSVQAAIVALLGELQRAEGLTLVFITHNLPLVAHLADQVIVLRHGRVVEQGPTEQILIRPEDPYTKTLLADTPKMTEGS